MKRIRVDRPLTSYELRKRYLIGVRADPIRSQHRLEGLRVYRLRMRYGITVEDYEALVVLQQGRCAICKQIPKGRLHVDHNHATGNIRGLLCGLCNRALGYIEHPMHAAWVNYLLSDGTLVPRDSIAFGTECVQPGSPSAIREEAI